MTPCTWCRGARGWVVMVTQSAPFAWLGRTWVVCWRCGGEGVEL